MINNHIIQPAREKRGKQHNLKRKIRTFSLADFSGEGFFHPFVIPQCGSHYLWNSLLCLLCFQRFWSIGSESNTESQDHLEVFCWIRDFIIKILVTPSPTSGNISCSKTQFKIKLFTFVSNTATEGKYMTAGGCKNRVGSLNTSGNTLITAHSTLNYLVPM